LCNALGIEGRHNGADLARGELTLHLGDEPTPELVVTGPRVGLREAADHPWRFWLRDEPTVSTYRPAAPLRRRQG
jgi:DNA-3-methyladenine glycosylase